MNDPISWLRPILTEEESDANGLIEAVAEARSRGLSSTIWDEQEADARRALRQVQAHRAVLTAYDDALSRKQYYDRDGEEEWFRGQSSGYVEAMEDAIKRLVSIYSDRDGYDPSWSA